MNRTANFFTAACAIFIVIGITEGILSTTKALHPDTFHLVLLFTGGFLDLLYLAARLVFKSSHPNDAIFGLTTSLLMYGGSSLLLQRDYTPKGCLWTAILAGVLALVTIVISPYMEEEKEK